VKLFPQQIEKGYARFQLQIVMLSIMVSEHFDALNWRGRRLRVHYTSVEARGRYGAYEMSSG
jgi:hypothetical protein